MFVGIILMDIAANNFFGQKPQLYINSTLFTFNVFYSKI